MKYLLIILLILTSCNATKQCENHVRKAKIGGCLRVDSFKTIVHDTTLKEVHIKDSAETKVDVRIVDSLRITDTCFSKARTDNFRKAITMTPISIKDTNYSLDIWMDKGVVKYKLNIKPCVSTTINSGTTQEIEKAVEKIPTWTKFLIGFLALLAIVLAFKK